MHDDVQYTVIIGGFLVLHAYHMYHMKYSAVLQMSELGIRIVSIWKFDTENLSARPSTEWTILYASLCSHKWPHHPVDNNMHFF